MRGAQEARTSFVVCKFHLSRLCGSLRPSHSENNAKQAKDDVTGLDEGKSSLGEAAI